jgi:exodeoxyribonuclease V beta subunit
MVWAALTSPLRLGDDAVLEGGLATAGNVLKEMELIYPIPEDHHPLLGEPGGGDAAPPFSVRRGMIRGFVDLIFEHGSRVIFLDYKSDSLPDWDPATVAAHVEDHYLLQAQIYALGLVRMLRIRSESEYESRFGGLAYLFVRGMDDRGRGVYFDRPPFARIVEWERGLGARPYPTPGLSGGVW